MHQGYTTNLKFTNLIFHYVLLYLLSVHHPKKIVNILAPLAGNTELHVRNSSDFVESINNLRLEDDEILVSFDVVSLFTNIPTTLAVEIAKKRLTECDSFKNVQIGLYKTFARVWIFACNHHILHSEGVLQTDIWDADGFTSVTHFGEFNHGRH